MSDLTFNELVLSKVSPGGSFRPMATYDADGDCIDFLTSNESYRAERIDSLVTVYYGRESKEIIGSLIKGVSKFVREVVERSPGFKIEIRDGRIKLVHLFTAGLWGFQEGPGGPRAITYQKLREAAEKAGAEADVEDLALT
jgi:hypothetical protein